jgi:hypothetical protein
MANLKTGDRVRIADRATTPQDSKTGLFFNHYRGLPGSVQKVYKDQQVAVEVELDALPEEVWKRHMATRDQMRQRWMDGLADDVRRKLTPEQKQFQLRYVVLVSAADVEKQRVARSRRVE